MNEVEILDPTSEQEPENWPLAPRLLRHSGTHIGLLDISKPQGDLFLDEIERRLREQGLLVTRYRKPTMTRPAVPELVKEIVGTCDAAVVALAD